MTLVLQFFIVVLVIVALSYRVDGARFQRGKHRDLNEESPRLSESDRVAQWYARGNTWPPTWQNETPEYQALMAAREEELQRLPGADERWENYMQFTASRMVPRFTKYGFKVMQTPAEAQAILKGAVDKALENFDGIRDEAIIDVLYTPIPSKFVDLPAESLKRVQEILKPYHEEWVGGMALHPTSIYGIRMNRNASSLVMHYDKVCKAVHQPPPPPLL
jgi:hypothetical protein